MTEPVAAAASAKTVSAKWTPTAAKRHGTAFAWVSASTSAAAAWSLATRLVRTASSVRIWSASPAATTNAAAVAANAATATSASKAFAKRCRCAKRPLPLRAEKPWRAIPRTSRTSSTCTSVSGGTRPGRNWPTSSLRSSTTWSRPRSATSGTTISTSSLPRANARRTPALRVATPLPSLRWRRAKPTTSSWTASVATWVPSLLLSDASRCVATVSAMARPATPAPKIAPAPMARAATWVSAVCLPVKVSSAAMTAVAATAANAAKASVPRVFA